MRGRSLEGEAEDRSPLEVLEGGPQGTNIRKNEAETFRRYSGT